MTFSTVARCARTGMFRVAISSSSPAVAARCAFARAGAGAAASQNVTDPSLGPRALDLMAGGLTAARAMRETARTARFPEYRQVLAVDAAGGTGVHTGAGALGVHARAEGPDAAAAGNLLAGDGVPRAMLEGFLASEGHLGGRLIAAPRAGREAGGEAGPLRSAGMMVVDAVPWPVADLRCDWTDACPIEAVAAAWAVYAPQMNDYVRRALHPGAAPSYGVPGDKGQGGT